MSSTRMATTVCTRSWTGSPKICSWIVASNRRSARCSSSDRQGQYRTAITSTIGRKLHGGSAGPSRGAGGRRRPSGAWRFQTLDDYDSWRDVTDFAVSRCEELMDDPGRLRHSPTITPRMRKRASAQRSRGCATCLKTMTVTSRRPWQGNKRVRTSGCARSASPASSTNPEKLRELRQLRAERKTEKSERQQQSKGRYWSMRT